MAFTLASRVDCTGGAYEWVCQFFSPRVVASSFSEGISELDLVKDEKLGDEDEKQQAHFEASLRKDKGFRQLVTIIRSNMGTPATHHRQQQQKEEGRGPPSSQDAGGVSYQQHEGRGSGDPAGHSE